MTLKATPHFAPAITSKCQARPSQVLDGYFFLSRTINVEESISNQGLAFYISSSSLRSQDFSDNLLA